MATREAQPGTRHNDVYDPLSHPEERRVLYATLDSFRQYRRAAHYNITHLRRQSFYTLSTVYMETLSGAPFQLPNTFNAIDDAIDSNADLAESILAVGLQSFGVDADDDSWKGHATPSDMDKARSTIKQFYRDWSAEGLPERYACYSPILSALDRYSNELEMSQRWKKRVLVPGAGLGRLVFDICAAGYTVEGNEISYHQLMASNYILNCTSATGQHSLFPWVLGFSNHINRSNQLQCVSVPDIHPSTELEARSTDLRSSLHYSERMSMTAGDFCELYKQPEYRLSFHFVATCFFIDTAPNFISYIETVRHCLQSGGIWINFGPLLWHFESAPTPAEKNTQDQAAQHTTSEDYQHFSTRDHDSSLPGSQGIGAPGSFELSNEEVVALVEHFGFEMLEQKQAPAGTTGYIQDPASMLQYIYRPEFWVARKL